jgi:hypothetical protein
MSPNRPPIYHQCQFCQGAKKYETIIASMEKAKRFWANTPMPKRGEISHLGTNPGMGILLAISKYYRKRRNCSFPLKWEKSLFPNKKKQSVQSVQSVRSQKRYSYITKKLQHLLGPRGVHLEEE